MRLDHLLSKEFLLFIFFWVVHEPCPTLCGVGVVDDQRLLVVDCCLFLVCHIVGCLERLVLFLIVGFPWFVHGWLVVCGCGVRVV